MAIKVYLIRHGRTEWNVAGKLQGWGDSPLVEEGIEGARLTGKALKNVPLTACYSSEMKRAQDTANYIIGSRSIPHFHHAGLNEFYFGKWEGRYSADLAEHPEYKQLRQQPASYQAIESQGETIEQLYQRIMLTFWEIIERHQDGEHILIVSHGMTLTLLTAILKGLPWQNFRNPQQHAFVQNTAINLVSVENGQTELLEFNNIAHLNEVISG